MGLGCVVRPCRYAALTAANVIHNVAFFSLLGLLGAVGSAAMKGAQSVCVFAIGAAFFCGHEQLQCYTPTKAASMVVVAIGLLIYAGSFRQSQIGVQKDADEHC